MNGITMMIIAIVVLGGAYLLYGRYLQNKWGIDPKAKTPAYEMEDGVDYVPADTNVVFGHQFASIAGAGPINGPIQAAIFGWLPVMLWILIGGVFFGAVQDFASMYASVKNKGRTIGYIIEAYIGKLGKKLFLLFCWLFCILVVAAFADVVAGTFNGFVANDAGAVTKVAANGAVATTSMLFIFEAVALGFFLKYTKFNKWINTAVAILLLVLAIALGLKFPVYVSLGTWHIIIFAYILVASVAPVWALLQPRDYLSVFLLLGMILAGVVGILVGNPTINMPAFKGFTVANRPLFPILFVTIACGAVSGFHSLVSSGTSSKTISNEKDMLPVGYGAMLIESVLGVVSLVIACSVAVNGALPKATPFAIFGSAIGRYFSIFGIPPYVSNCIVTMCISALAMTTIDAVTRIGRMMLQELLSEYDSNAAKFLSNTYVATIVTLIPSYLLCLGGYLNIWPLFGAANQLLSALVLIALAVFLRTTGRKSWMLYIPMTFMFVVTMSALCLSLYGIYGKLMAGTFVLMVDGLQLVVALALMFLALMVVKHCGKELVGDTAKSQTAQ